MLRNIQRQAAPTNRLFCPSLSDKFPPLFSGLPGWRVTSPTWSKMWLVAWESAVVTTAAPFWNIQRFSTQSARSSCTKQAERSEEKRWAQHVAFCSIEYEFLRWQIVEYYVFYNMSQKNFINNLLNYMHPFSAADDGSGWGVRHLASLPSLESWACTDPFWWSLF